VRDDSEVPGAAASAGHRRAEMLAELMRFIGTALRSQYARQDYDDLDDIAPMIGTGFDPPVVVGGRVQSLGQTHRYAGAIHHHRADDRTARCCC
jgi:hypothetical protein